MEGLEENKIPENTPEENTELKEIIPEDTQPNIQEKIDAEKQAEKEQFEKFLLNTQHELASELNGLLSILGYRESNRLNSLVSPDSLSYIQRIKNDLQNESLNIEKSAQSIETLSRIMEEPVPNGGREVRENVQTLDDLMRSISKVVNSTEKYADTLLKGKENNPEYATLLPKINHLRDSLQVKKVRLSIMRGALG